MKLVAGQINNTYIEYDVIRQNIDLCTEVIAIVAYCDSTRLFDLCKHAGKRVRFYGRLDHSAPVSSNVLSWFLNAHSLNYSCALFRGGLHAKAIWLKGVGVYIGSANLTENGWVTNVEAGTFMSEPDLSQVFIDELDSLIEGVHGASVPLSEEIFDLVKKLEKRRSAIREADKKDARWFDDACPVPKVRPLNTVITGESAVGRRKAKFIKEWNQTLQILRNISTSRLSSSMGRG